MALVTNIRYGQGSSKRCETLHSKLRRYSKLILVTNATSGGGVLFLSRSAKIDKYEVWRYCTQRIYRRQMMQPLRNAREETCQVSGNLFSATKALLKRLQSVWLEGSKIVRGRVTIPPTPLYPPNPPPPSDPPPPSSVPN